MNKVKVKEITIQTSDGEINLSVDDAKELADELNNLFGKQRDAFVPYPVYPTYPHIEPYYTLSCSAGDIRLSASDEWRLTQCML